MDQDKSLPKVYYSIKETPWYFGAFLNQARHNLFLTLNEISVKLGKEPVPNDDLLLNSYALSILKQASPEHNKNEKTGKINPSKIEPVRLEKAMELIDRNLPFLFSMHYKYSTEEEKNIKKGERDKEKITKPIKNLTSDPGNYYAILKLLIDFLYKARNHFSHYSNTSFEISKEIEYLLNDVFDINVRIIKHRFKLDNEQTEHLRRFEDKEKGQIKALRKKNFKYSFVNTKGSREITEYGLAFFISLFLPRGQAYLFLKKISGFKGGGTDKFDATLDTFCASTLWLPKERVESDNSNQAFFLDMCNELAKCPKELYELLKPENQKLFISKNNEEAEMAEAPGSLAEIEDENNEETEIESLPDTKMVRKNSRFTFFALRYFDAMKSFGWLRFGIDIGTFYYSIYPKTIAGNTELRQLTRHLLGYGHLSNFAKENRPPDFAALFKDISPLNDEHVTPNIKEMYPQYWVENNVIPVYITNPEKQVYWPSIKIETTNGEKSYPNKFKSDKDPKPYAFLSANELPAMLFYDLIRNESDPDMQLLITNHMSWVKKFFKDVRDGVIKPLCNEVLPAPASKAQKENTASEYERRLNLLKVKLREYELKPAYIPDKLRDFLLGIGPSDWKKNAKRRLDEMIEETKERQEKMEEREKINNTIKPGKIAFRKIKVGKLADILAEDMMLMQPVEKDENNEPVVSSKANSTAYRLLQSRLAFFGKHKQEIPAIFKACNLTEGRNNHPFLSKIRIDDNLGIIEFYKEYFKEKGKYLERLKERGQFEHNDYHFLKIKQDQWKINELIDVYLNEKVKVNNEYRIIDYTPPLLPRGLFFSKCMDWFAVNGSQIMKTYVRNFENKSNSVHLINYYFEHELNDAGQDFYDLEKSYKIFNRIQDKKEIPVYMELEKRAHVFLEKKNLVTKYQDEMEQYKKQAAEDIIVITKEINRVEGIKQLKDYISRNFESKYPELEPKIFDKIFIKDFKKKIPSRIKGIIEESIAKREQTIRAFQYYLDNEQILRLLSVQDKLLFMCIKKMMQKQVDGINLADNQGKAIETNMFLLKNVVPVNDNNNKNILDCTPVNGITMLYTYFNTNEKGNPTDEAGKISITDKHLKIKNAGNFRKLMKDRRLNNLCFYFDSGTDEKVALNRMVVENELNDYDACRPKVLEQIAGFEKIFYEKYNDKAMEWFCDKKGVQSHNLFLNKFFELHPGMESPGLKNQLISIRNGFLHNQYPRPVMEGNLFQGFKIKAEEWKQINDNFIPASKGSTLGYGIIGKMASFAIIKYKELSQAIKQMDNIK